MLVTGIVLISISVLLILSILGYFYVNHIENDLKKIRRYKKEYSEISIEKLQSLVENAILSLNYSFDLKNTIEQEKESAVMFYKSNLENTLKQVTPFFSKPRTNYIKKLEPSIIQYKVKYFKVLFLINEINLGSEIIDSVFYQFKALYSKVKKEFNNNLLSLSFNSGYFASDISTIERWFIKVEEQTNEYTLENIHEVINEVIYKFERMLNDVNIINLSEDMIEKSRSIVEQIKTVISANKSLFKSNARNIEQKIIEINKNIVSIENESTRRNTSNIHSMNTNLKNNLISISSIVELEIESYALLKENMSSFNILFQNIFREKEMLVNEVIRTNLSNSDKLINDISGYSNIIHNKMIDIDNLKSKGFKDSTPSKFVEKYYEVSDVLKKYITLSHSILQEIKNILDVANKTNNSIFEINLKLLNIEQKRSKLPDSIQMKFEDKLNKVQILFNNFIYLQRNQKHSVEISKEDSIISVKLMEKVDEYNKLLNELYLSDRVIKQSIIELNKYIDKKRGIEQMIDTVEVLYNQNKYQQCLVQILKICKEYKIYE